MWRSLVMASGLFLSLPAVGAEPGIVGRRGDGALLFGSCVPSLVAENRSAETIEYQQVDILYTLANGEQRDIELQSAYREGIHFPIAPGAKAILKQHLDLSRALGVPCDEVQSRKVVGVLCQASGGRSCTAPVLAEP